MHRKSERESNMDLGSFGFDPSAVRQWLDADHACEPTSAAATPDWDPLEVGAEDEVIKLLDSVQRQRLLIGPTETVVSLIYIDDPNEDAYHVVVDVKPTDDTGPLRLASAACEWNMIAPGEHTGIDAVMAILDTITTVANAVLRQLKQFAAPYEQAAYDRAMEDSLDVTDGIEAHDTCGCGEPIALYEDSWFHVYNERLRGTDDHDPCA
jgi:hypothetical protein